MKQSQAKDFLPIIQAMAEGKTVEMLDSATQVWHTMDNDFDYGLDHPYGAQGYRIKPEPKLRPWRPEEVPVGAIFRHSNWEHGYVTIVEVINDKFYIPTFGKIHQQTNEYFTKSDLQYSLDHGKTWHPCGVLE